MSELENTYTCAACGNTYEKEWTDEEAWAEAESAFEPDELKDTSIVCEDCWQGMRGAMPDFNDRYKANATENT